ncbi:ATP-binding protein [Amycolatopsis sp. NPDC051373]|uniref:ATP-binding protein n=1 Tax=Amycolatopsis sp. NPDC051373 TaxID=3155801 RepID=UPI00344F4DEF
MVEERNSVLFGRELEQKRLAELVDGVGERGGALLVRGEPGVGKSALVATVRRQLGPSRTTILTATGAEPEQHLPYAGLNQLLYPLRDATTALPATQRTALRTALGLVDGPAPQTYLVGLVDGPAPQTYLVGLAVLNLLSEAAAATPLVLLLEDVHWLDRATQDVLAFLARRVESEPVVLIATARDDEPTRLDDLPSLTLAAWQARSPGTVISTWPCGSSGAPPCAASGSSPARWRANASPRSPTSCPSTRPTRGWWRSRRT